MTAKERAFCEKYAECLNATKAYLEVYQGTYETAHSQGWRKLQKQELMEYIQTIQKQRVASYGDVPSAILQALIKDAFELDENGNHKNSTWQKSLQLLQRQLGLEKSTVELNTNQININIIGESDE